MLFQLLLVLSIVGAAALALRVVERDFSGWRGRCYADICHDLYRQTERRGRIFVALASSQAGRVGKLERR